MEGRASVSGNVPLIGALNVTLMALAGVAFALLCWQTLGVGLGWSLAITGIAWLSVDIWRVSVIPLSEPLFVLTLVAGLLWAAPRGTDEPRDRPPAHWAPILIVFAVLVHLRSIGLALGAGAMTAALADRRWRRAGGLGVAFALILTPWTVWSSRANQEIPGSMRDVLGSYGGFISDRVGSGAGQVFAQLPLRAVGLADWCLAMLLPGVPSGVRWALGIVVLPLLVIGFRDLTRRSRLVGPTVLFLLAALWVWPFVDRRLMAPLVPWLVLGLVLGARVLTGVGSGKRRQVGVVAMASWAAWFAVTSVVGLARGWHDAAYRIRGPAVLAAAEAVALHTPSGSVVGAPELWAAIHLYTGRPVAPSAPFKPGSADGPVWGTPSQQFRVWQEGGVEYVVAEHGGLVHGAAFDEIDRRCRVDALDVTASWEGALLVRLAWDQACRESVGRGG